MIDAKRLLTDLKRLRRTLDADLRTVHATGTHRDAVQAEWQGAFDSGRTRETFEAFLDAAFDQSVVHWVLGCVFLRFLEDNGLVDRPFLSGPSEDRRDLARERQESYFRARPHDSDAEYLLATFEEAARLPGLSGLFDPAHNPLFRLPLSGDGAMALLRFFREVVPETGALAHDFTDAEWNTRFLGDLYQDLSEDARKRYALLQTPDFVESWILDRTLEPAIQEFCHEQLRMIDPACGSGHFLLGGFARLLREWQRHAPGLPATELAQRALDGVAGVDLNPFAVEIARFRLLVAALRAGGVSRMASAPAFRMHLAAGDSLLHGRHFARHELGGAADGFRRVLRHHYMAEDTAELESILGRQYHAVVGNPPYITPKDPAMRDAYREIYTSCHMKYGLGAPFTERFFDLALQGTRDRAAGFVGLIVANSFMKREFGKKLIEEVLPRLDLTHVVDCSGAYIPGHGTPTVILFGRNRAPVQSIVRVVMGVRGEPSTPTTPSQGRVWLSIVAETDCIASDGEFVTVADLSRPAISRHPWSIGGGGIRELKEHIENNSSKFISDVVSDYGIMAVTGDDDAYVFSKLRDIHRLKLESYVPFVEGEQVRNFSIQGNQFVVWPYDEQMKPFRLSSYPGVGRHFWKVRSHLLTRRRFGRPMVDRGLSWYELQELYARKLRFPVVVFSEMATHNHCAVLEDFSICKSTASVLVFDVPDKIRIANQIAAILGSSLACFFLKQVSQNKGSSVDVHGARTRSEPFEDFYQIISTQIGRFPLPDNYPKEVNAKNLTIQSRKFSSIYNQLALEGENLSESIYSARCSHSEHLSEMVCAQEEIDWECYALYGLTQSAHVCSAAPPLRLGERAFEIVMARRMAAGNLETTWFERHRSTPITVLPTDWPTDYRAVVERRIELIESDPTIGLIERPEYKRRWSGSTWEELEQDALRAWLLDRLEDSRLWPSDDPRLVSTNQLADLLRRDADFLAVAGVYRGRPDFDLEALVAELVAKEAVPFLSVLRYAETGLRKREQWEQTWGLQRREDAIDAEVAERRPEFTARAELAAQESWRGFNARRPAETPEAYAARMAAGVDAQAVQEQADRLIAQEQTRRKREEVGPIPVPPKYRTPDFQSQDFWRLRNGLDVPKERFVSFPGCHRDADGSLVVTWAGYDHLARAKAIAAYYLERKEADGWSPERLIPLLAGLIELLPWLRQWHNDYDPDTGERMGDYFAVFVNEEARSLGMTEAAVAAWQPVAVPRRGRGRRASA